MHRENPRQILKFKSDAFRSLGAHRTKIMLMLMQHETF